MVVSVRVGPELNEVHLLSVEAHRPSDYDETEERVPYRSYGLELSIARWSSYYLGY